MKNTPKHIIQIFNKSLSYSKELKSFEDRKDFSKWKSKIISKSGYVENNTAYLSKGKIKAPLNGNTILLIDYNRLEDYEKEENHILNGDIVSSVLSWSILKFKKKDRIEVFLNWNYWELGNPKREQFKLGDLKENQPLEIKINGKRDFSFASRRERVFLEKNFIITYLGKVEKIDFLSEDKLKKEKLIPVERKLVNLLKNIK